MKYAIIDNGRFLILPTRFYRENAPHPDESWVIKPYLWCTKQEIIDFGRFKCKCLFSLSESRIALKCTLPKFQFHVDLQIVPVKDLSLSVSNFLRNVK